MIPVLHGFGQRYDLPISLSLYLFAAAAVVVLSFVLVVVAGRDQVGAAAVRYPRRRAALLDAAVRSPAPRAAGGALGILALAAIVATGLFGSQQAARSPAEYLLWVYFWAGAVIATGVVGNVFTLISPWAALHRLLARVVRLPRPRPLPAGVGIWPAVATYFLYACLELTSGVASRPQVIGALALLYTVAMVAGMVVFGAAEFTRACDGFTVLFALIAAFAPLEVEGEGRAARVYIRPFGAGLLRREAPGWDRIVFIVLTLSTLAFDGLLATPAFASLAGSLRPSLDALGPLAQPVLRTVLLAALTGIFLGAFSGVMRLVLWFGWPQGPPGGRDVQEAMTAFALTLVPIALVYNAAHNYTYLVVQSQGLIPALADPFGAGWRLLPTAGYAPSFALAGAAVVWYLQVVLIVLGHVAAVYLAHLRAGERFRSATHVILSQYPMLLLMVVYTMTSLWILAQPITRDSG